MTTNDIIKPTIKVGRTTNIKYEKPEDFEISVSYDVYKKAFDITEEIILDNQNYKKNLSSSKVSGTTLRNTEQIFNVIFFTGDRGTGKTSVMLSYMEFLKDYYRNNRNKEVVVPSMEFDSSNYMFTGLEYIEASSLDSKEDILGSILSKMLKKWDMEEKRSYGSYGIRREEDYVYKKRQIHKRFNEVYKYLKNLRSNKDIMDEDSDMFMETLENMSMTWNLKYSFQQLVSEYLEIMEYPGSEGAIGTANHYLVISIDDLDLNIDKGFELLDQVRKYLMIPNIIVLLSANYEQLEKVCVNHYIKKFKEIKSEPETKKYIIKLSREYLEKIVPVQRQVILYSGKKWSLFNECQFELEYDYPNEKNVNFTGTLNDMVVDDIKKYIGIEAAASDKMLYYLTPDTLRELVSWVNQISFLVEIDEMDIGKEEDMYASNIKWFWNKQFPWLVKKYLSSDEQKIFETIDTLEPLGQILYLKKVFGKEDAIDLNISLVKILSELSQGTMEEQRFVSLCLLYFSVRLSEILTALPWLDNKERASLIIFLNIIMVVCGGLGKRI